jgi:hypothetical protein
MKDEQKMYVKVSFSTVCYVRIFFPKTDILQNIISNQHAVFIGHDIKSSNQHAVFIGHDVLIGCYF